MKKKLFSLSCCLILLFTAIFTACKTDVATTESSVAPKVTYTVTFDAKGHGTAPDKLSGISAGAKITKPEDLAEDGWIFGGWCKEEECNTVWDFDKDTVTKNITLYAKWTEKGTVSSVSFNTAAGAVDKGHKIELSCDTPNAKIYYTDNGSAPTKSSTPYEKSKGIVLNSAKTIKAIAICDGMKDSAVTEAAYTIKTYTVTFNANGHGKTPASKSDLVLGDKITTPGDLTAEGWNFGGWYKDSGFNTVWDFGTDTVKDDMTLYAKWTEKTYKVTFVYGDNTTGNLERTGVKHGTLFSAIKPATPQSPREKISLGSRK